jgi:hypothetical protein
MSSATPTPSDTAVVYSYLSDEKLLELNALATAAAPEAAQYLATELALLVVQQNASRRSPCKTALEVTAEPLTQGEWEAVAAKLDTCNIVERAGALTWLLDSLSHGTVESRAARAQLRPQWQRQLSQLLVRYPVLLDPRLMFHGRAAARDCAPLAHLMAFGSFTSLPMASHGIGSEDLRAFASCASVRAGLTREAPVAAILCARLGGTKPLDVALELDRNEALCPCDDDALRGGFIVSLLQLSEIARQATGHGIVTPEVGFAARNNTYRTLALTFWDLTSKGGIDAGVTREDFVAAMRLPTSHREHHDQTNATYTPLIERSKDLESDFLAALGQTFDEGMTRRWDDHRRTHEHKAATVPAAVEMLVAVGAHSDAKAAATWLSGQAIGDARYGRGQCTRWPEADIASFLLEIERFGVLVELERQRLNSPDAEEVQAWDRWSHAVEILGREVRLREVIERERAAQACAGADTPPPQRSQRRGAL